MADMLHLADLSDDELAERYRAPKDIPWLRLNFVATLDGAAQGSDGLSGGINNEADHKVFRLLRRLADVIVVGAGTVRAEAYRPNPKPFVVVTRSGAIPESMLAGDTSKLMIATGERAPHLEESRERLGDDNVLVLGEEGPDLVRLRHELVERGLRVMLCEGGPHLARDLFAARLVDEVCLTVVPKVIADDLLRMTAGPAVDADCELTLLLEHEGTLLTRWRVRD